MLPHHRMQIGFFFHHLTVAVFIHLTSLQFIFLRILFRKGTPSKHLSRYWPLWVLFGKKKKSLLFLNSGHAISPEAVKTVCCYFAARDELEK